MNPLPASPHSLAPRPRRRGSRARLLAGIGACLLAAGACGAVIATSARAQAALGNNWYEGAPYYSTLDSAGPDLGQVMAATGQKAFDMAFILSGGSCAPSWDVRGCAGSMQVFVTTFSESACSAPAGHVQ